MPKQPQLWPQESKKHPLPSLPVHFIFPCSICLGGKPVISEIILAPLQVGQELEKALGVTPSVLPVPLQIGHFCHIIYKLRLKNLRLIISCCALNRICNSLCGLILLHYPMHQVNTRNCLPLLWVMARCLLLPQSQYPFWVCLLHGNRKKE